MTDGDDDMPWRKYRHVDPRRGYVHAVHTIGRRGVIFIAFGVLWLMQSAAMGIGVAASAIDGPARVIYIVTALVWAASGVAGVAGATRPQGRDGLSTKGLYIAPATGVAVGGIRVGLWIVPNDVVEALSVTANAIGSPFGVIEIIGYGCLTVVVLAVAGWRENLPHGRDSP